MLDPIFLIETAAKSLVVAGAALGVLHLTKRRSAAERSLIGHLGLIALLLLPAVSLLIPGWNPLPVGAPAAAPAVHLPVVATAAPAAAGAASRAVSEMPRFMK